MCGLTGVAGVINQKEREAFRTLLILDTIRGPHSTGVASVDKNGDWDMVKKKGNAWDLFDSREYTSMVARTSYCLIGHNRYATKGKINNINAHPFEFEHVVGCHNGTIRQQWRMIDHTDFEVDSENIFHSINEVGLEDTLGVLDGAYALTYWDKRSQELIMARNIERPLYYTFSPDNKTVFWASEEWMLSVAISRAGLKYGEIVEVRPTTIVRFNIDKRFAPNPIQTNIQYFKEFKAPPARTAVNNGQVWASQQKKPSPSTEQLTGADTTFAELAKLKGCSAEFTVEGTKQTAQHQWYIQGRLKEFPEVEVRVFEKVSSSLWNRLVINYDSLWEGDIASYSKVGDTLQVTMTCSTVMEVWDDGDDDDDDVVFDTYVGYNNKLLTDEEFCDLTGVGCAWCTVSVQPVDHKKLHWVSPDAFVCADCQEMEEVQDYLALAN